MADYQQQLTPFIHSNRPPSVDQQKYVPQEATGLSAPFHAPSPSVQPRGPAPVPSPIPHASMPSIQQTVSAPSRQQHTMMSPPPIQHPMAPPPPPQPFSPPPIQQSMLPPPPPQPFSPPPIQHPMAPPPMQQPMAPPAPPQTFSPPDPRQYQSPPPAPGPVSPPSHPQVQSPPPGAPDHEMYQSYPNNAKQEIAHDSSAHASHHRHGSYDGFYHTQWSEKSECEDHPGSKLDKPTHTVAGTPIRPEPSPKKEKKHVDKQAASEDTFELALEGMVKVAGGAK